MQCWQKALILCTLWLFWCIWNCASVCCLFEPHIFCRNYLDYLTNDFLGMIPNSYTLQLSDLSFVYNKKRNCKLMEPSELLNPNVLEEKPRYSGGGIAPRSSPQLASIKSCRSLSLSVVALPSEIGIVVTPSPEDQETAQESVERPSCKHLQKDKSSRARPRLSIPAIFSSPTSPSPLIPTGSISSLLTAAANRGFSFNIPLSGLRRASWSVSF